jgi:ESX secretion system protein EccD
VVATCAFASVPALPMLSYRLAGLPIPSIPTDPEDLKSDTETVAGSHVLALSERADEFLGGMLGALAVIGGCAALALALTGGRPGMALSAVLGLLMLTRARWFISRRQRLPLLVAGVFALGVDGIVGFAAADQVLRLSVGVGSVLAVAAVIIAYAVTGSTKRRSPMLGRTLDIFETILILAVVPLAVWVSGLYDWIRSIREG